MNDDEQEIIEAGAAGAPEGAPATEPTTDEVASMYKELGIKSAAPVDKSKKRSQANDVRDKKSEKDGAGSTNSGDGKNADDKNEPKNAPATDENVDSGDDTDKKGAKEREDKGKVSDKSKKTDDGVRGDESRKEGDSERGSKKDPESGTDGAGQKAHESGDEEEEGKRPGKSNPEVEKRFQKLTSEVKQRDEAISAKDTRIAELEKAIADNERKQAEAKVAETDPEYTVDDFRKVRDNKTGEIHDLDEDQAELAYRRWKDGYDQRSEQRNAEINRQEALAKVQSEYAEKVMRDSVEAYDTLASLMDEYPELVTTNENYDKDFAAVAMPVINEAIIYKEGTEPGNADGNKPVIVGMKINPKVLLKALSDTTNAKRDLPLNGLNDNVEPRSNVSVAHSRSSDPTVNAANQLMKELNINKRF